MSQTKVVYKIKTHILCSVTSFRKSCRLWDNVENHGGARVAADNMMHARCMQDKLCHPSAPVHPHPYTHARAQAHACTRPRARTHPDMCNTYCFFVPAPQCYVIHTLPFLFIFIKFTLTSTHLSAYLLWSFCILTFKMGRMRRCVAARLLALRVLIPVMA